MKKKQKEDRYTVMVENHFLDKVTGEAINHHFILYSSPTNRLMASAIAENLKRCGKSYRIVTKDNGPGSEIVEFWYREGFRPVDGR